jgi:hypothetical protein
VFRDATRTRLRAVGIGPATEDLPGLSAVDQVVLLGGPGADSEHPDTIQAPNNSPGDTLGPAGWSAAILNIIS